MAQPGRRRNAEPTYYDSLLAKVIAWGEDRTEAIGRMDHALAHLRVEGVSTTTSLHQAIVRHPQFRARQVNTRWVEDVFIPGWIPRTSLGS